MDTFQTAQMDLLSRCVQGAGKPLAMFLSDSLTILIGKRVVEVVSNDLLSKIANGPSNFADMSEMQKLDLPALLQIFDNCLFIDTKQGGGYSIGGYISDDKWKIEFRALFGIPRNADHKNKALRKLLQQDIPGVRETRNFWAHFSVSRLWKPRTITGKLYKFLELYQDVLLQAVESNPNRFSPETKTVLLEFINTVENAINHLEKRTTGQGVDEVSAQEKAEQEKAEQEKAEQEKAEREKAEREKAEREQAERERAERERAEREKAERERAERERAERERAERAWAERAWTERDRAERERAERERAERERAERERAERERVERERAERESIERERAERERTERERAERERAERERTERERAERERAERERAERERTEQQERHSRQEAQRRKRRTLLLGVVGITTIVLAAGLYFGGVFQGESRRAVLMLVLDTIPESKMYQIAQVARNQAGSVDEIEIAYLDPTGREVNSIAVKNTVDDIAGTRSALNAVQQLRQPLDYGYRFDVMYEKLQAIVSDEQKATLMILGSVGNFSNEDRQRLIASDVKLYQRTGMSAWWVSNKVAPPTFVYWSVPTKSDSALFTLFSDKTDVMKPVVEVVR